jgi:hypothetical protein
MSLNSRIKKLEQEVVAPPLEDIGYPSHVDWVFETAFNTIRDSIEFDKLEHFLNSLAPDGSSEEQQEKIAEKITERLSKFVEAQAQQHSNHDSPLVFPSILVQAWLEDETLVMMSDDCEDCGYLHPSHQGTLWNGKLDIFQGVQVYKQCVLCSGGVGHDARFNKMKIRKGSHLGSKYPYAGGSLKQK